MDFGSLRLRALIFTGVIVIPRQVFRLRAISFGQHQAPALEHFANTFSGDHSTAMALKKGEVAVYQTRPVSLVETAPARGAPPVFPGAQADSRTTSSGKNLEAAMLVPSLAPNRIVSIASVISSTG